MQRTPLSSSSSLLDSDSGHKDRVWSVAWSHSGTVLASCGGDKTVSLVVLPLETRVVMHVFRCDMYGV